MRATHREGFICPVCRYQYDSDEQLMTHFEVAHSTNKGSDDEVGVGAVIKKVQQKLFNKQDSESLDTQSSVYEEGDVYQPSEPAGLKEIMQQQNQFSDQYAATLAMARSDGRCRSLLADFLTIRRERIDRRVIETNKMLFRLEKLLMIELNIDANKRHQLEQEVVTWIGDKDMPICPHCGSSFSKLNITRRRHHCRLCGALVCSNCSKFLNRSAAIQLVQMAQNQSYSSTAAAEMANLNPITSEDLFSTDSSGRRSPSSVSLNSQMTRSASMPIYAATRLVQGDDSKGGTLIRVCVYCAQCLERCRASTQTTISPISVVYDKLVAEREFIENYMKEYNEMVARLQEGDAIHSISAASELRLKLMNAIRKLDALSKSILENPDQFGTSSGIMRLCSNIRRASIDFAQKWGGMVSDLPTADEVERIRADRERQLAERVEREREQLAKKNMAKQVRVRQAPERVEGWAVAPGVNPTTDNDDPFEQQLEQIQSYMAQAESQGRMEEAAVLRQNYEELRTEMRRQKIREYLEGNNFIKFIVYNYRRDYTSMPTHQCDVCAQNFNNVPEYNIHKGLAHRARDSGVCNGVPPGRPEDLDYTENLRKHVFIGRVPQCSCDNRGAADLISHTHYSHPNIQYT